MIDVVFSLFVVLFVDHAAHFFQQVAGEDEVGEPVEVGVGLVAEEVFGVEGDGPHIRR